MKIGNVYMVRGELARYVGQLDGKHAFELPDGQRVFACEQDIELDGSNDPMAAVAFVMEHFTTRGGKMDEGDTVAYVLNDGVIVMSMEEGRELKINVVAGEPERLEVNLNLVKEKGQ